MVCTVDLERLPILMAPPSDVPQGHVLSRMVPCTAEASSQILGQPIVRPFQTDRIADMRVLSPVPLLTVVASEMVTWDSSQQFRPNTLKTSCLL